MNAEDIAFLSKSVKIDRLQITDLRYRPRRNKVAVIGKAEVNAGSTAFQCPDKIGDAKLPDVFGGNGDHDVCYVSLFDLLQYFVFVLIQQAHSFKFGFLIQCSLETRPDTVRHIFAGQQQDLGADDFLVAMFLIIPAEQHMQQVIQNNIEKEIVTKRNAGELLRVLCGDQKNDE